VLSQNEFLEKMLRRLLDLLSRTRDVGRQASGEIVAVAESMSTGDASGGEVGSGVAVSVGAIVGISVGTKVAVGLGVAVAVGVGVLTADATNGPPNTDTALV
jgi:hypothetical protein